MALPADARALVCGDLHLGPRLTTVSAQVQRDLVDRLSGWDGPGAVVLNGDVFELWGEPEATVEAALDAHLELTGALRAFAAAPGRHVVLVVGNHDAPIAWDKISTEALDQRIGASCALSADLLWDTPGGKRRVRCVHGHGYDPANALRDPRNPLDSPLGQHIVQEVLPEVCRTPMLADMGGLVDPNAVGQFLASRLVYRQLGRRAWWVLVPLMVALGLRVPVVVRLLEGSGELRRLQHWMILAGVGLVLDVALVIGLAVLAAQAVYATMAGSRLGPQGMHLNGAPRAAAAAACADGLAGLITGHTHQPELVAVPGGFYANTGCGVRCLEAQRARCFLPPVFAPILRRSWVEVCVDGGAEAAVGAGVKAEAGVAADREAKTGAGPDAGCGLRVQLFLAETPIGETTWLERHVLVRQQHRYATPRPVAALPGGGCWPRRQSDRDRQANQDLVRRRAGLATGAVGVVSVVSALTTPLRPRLGTLLSIMPVQVPQAAGASLVFVGATLLLLAWGLRRGRSLAWATTVGLLLVATALHLAKGIDVEEAIVAAGVGGWLVWHRNAFTTHPDSRQLRRASLAVAGGGVLVTAVSWALALATDAGGLDTTARAFAQRLLGDYGLPLPAPLPLSTPALLAAGLSLLLTVGWLVSRSRLRQVPNAAERAADLARARRIVAANGGGTLAYAALREDRSWFFTGDCVVAYDIRDGVCVVSPDPIGPAGQHANALAEFIAFADRRGWSVSVLAAGADMPGRGVAPGVPR